MLTEIACYLPADVVGDVVGAVGDADADVEADAGGGGVAVTLLGLEVTGPRW